MSSRSELLKASPPLFESRLLDRFSRVHVAVVPTIFLPLIGLLAWLALSRDVGAAGLAGFALVGYVLWTLTEYWLHRTVFHWEPDNALGRRFHFLVHGVHHDHPNDPLRLVMPPGASLPLAALFVGLWVLVFGLGSGAAVSAGFLAGYLAYDLLHYHVHHHTPRTWAGRKLRELHMRHHFQDQDTGYGVSAPWWDVVFRTAPRRSGNGRGSRVRRRDPAS